MKIHPKIEVPALQDSTAWKYLPMDFLRFCISWFTDRYRILTFVQMRWTEILPRFATASNTSVNSNI